MKAVGIIQARMGSHRLPGKVLKPIVGVPMLKHMMMRLDRCQSLDEVVIATTDQPQDQVLCDFAETNGYLVGKGSESDVLGRYYKVAKERKADVVIRLTADCPLIDSEVTDRVVKRHLDSKTNDITSNVLQLSYPNGFDTEALSFSCLERVHQGTQDPLYREHVTNYIHDYPEKFIMENVRSDEDRSYLRLCVDTDEDFDLIRCIYEALYPQNSNFGHREIYAFLDKNPELLKMNSKVQQTKILKRQTSH